MLRVHHAVASESAAIRQPSSWCLDPWSLPNGSSLVSEPECETAHDESSSRDSSSTGSSERRAKAFFGIQGQTWLGSNRLAFVFAIAI
ncbi:hypothetical protein HYQ46_001345 [Verticillium longisporum]|nr:hypothetical protein HYQ44_017821 [Verticillium longisporum]KAG7149731.1 hypothetical protein HYQ46_001345 [Verticillium longisporum]